jgi:enamine deaminase RidA (YjgF/YER057c/UK114 family)
MSVRQKIADLGLEFPAAPTPVGSYVPVVRTGNLIYTSGQLPTMEGRLLLTGKVGAEVDVSKAQASAAMAVLNALAAIELEVGSLDDVRQIVRLNVFVNSAPGFTDQATVANGASELLVHAFGNPGRHTRCALGVAELPLDAPVELDMTVEV